MPTIEQMQATIEKLEELREDLKTYKELSDIEGLAVRDWEYGGSIYCNINDSESGMTYRSNFKHRHLVDLIDYDILRVRAKAKVFEIQKQIDELEK